MASEITPPRDATLQDVARLAGVSTATVARTLKTPDLVAEDTRRRVNEVLAATNYMPNPLAKGLVSNRSNLAVILMPGVVSPIFSEAIFGITRKLGEAGILAVMCLTSPDEAEMDRIIRSILARRPNALILTGGHFSDLTKQRVRAAGITAIETWDIPPDPVDIAIGFDQRATGSAIARLLHERGRRSPLVISTPGRRSEERVRGFIETARELGMDEPACAIAPAAHGFLNGRECFAGHLAGGSRCDAVVCGSDLVAHGVLTEAGVRGLGVPEDIAVVGYGGTDISAHTVPPLTTIAIDSDAIAKAAAEVVLTRGRDQEPASKIIDVGFRLVVREST